jgi:hypothetical protein
MNSSNPTGLLISKINPYNPHIKTLTRLRIEMFRPRPQRLVVRFRHLLLPTPPHVSPFSLSAPSDF